MKFNAKNYLCINGKKTELTEEQLKQLGIITTPDVCFKDNGKIAKIGDYEFIVLSKNEQLGTVELLLKDSLVDSVFGDTCDFKTSKVKQILDKFAKTISDIVGEDNLIEHTVDLTSNDGLKDYGKTNAKMSLLTCDLYRKYVEVIDEYKLDNWWWTATPFSTPKHGYEKSVFCVSRLDFLSNSNGNCNCSGNGVRPFCILKSAIFVSCEG